MVYKVYSGCVGGILGDLITVEVDASPGLPGLEMIGLLGSEVKEAKDRVRVSLKNKGINLPAMKITVNLSPADTHKTGALYDLPIAVGILGVFGYLPMFQSEDTLLVGELSLDGMLKPVHGILPIVKMAKDHGFSRVVLPMQNAKEGAMIPGIDVIAANSLEEVMAYLNLPKQMGCTLIEPTLRPDFYAKETALEIPDFLDVAGQESVKRAALIAASGFHHLLMIGPPGTGKSLIAKRIPHIMPKLSYEESLEVTTIYSVAGKLSEENPFILKRPFLSAHHGSTPEALVGGGPQAAPGLISLSHKGILFLDELPEFKRQTIDYLRQPLEDGEITISRAKGTYTYPYPSSFMLVAAMNPCPCGYYPDRNRCTCSEPMISRYLSKVSGPILDRIDLCVEVTRMNPDEMNVQNTPGLSSLEMRSIVERVVDIQKERYAHESFSFNAEIPSSKIRKYIPLSQEAEKFMKKMYETFGLSMRSYYKMIRVGRTIADLDGEETVTVKHLAEASCYRFPGYMGG